LEPANPEGIRQRGQVQGGGHKVSLATNATWAGAIGWGGRRTLLQNSVAGGGQLYVGGEWCGKNVKGGGGVKGRT